MSISKIEELRKLAEVAPKDKIEMLPLKGKYYGTEMSIGDDEFNIWIADHFADPFASEREIANGWAPSDGHDHVEAANCYNFCKFIAAANPQTILALLDLVELLYETVEELRYSNSTNLAEHKYTLAIGAYIKFKEQS